MMTKLPRSALEWAPALGLGLLVALVAGVCSISTRDDSKPPDPVVVVVEPFAPLKVERFLLITPPPYYLGQVVTLQNGFCVGGSETITVEISLAIQEDVDPAVARYVSLIESRSFVYNPGDCYHSEPIKGPLPPNLAAGRWRIAALLIARGPQAGDEQRVPLVTDPFDVIDVR